MFQIQNGLSLKCPISVLKQLIQLSKSAQTAVWFILFILEMFQSLQQPHFLNSDGKQLKTIQNQNILLIAGVRKAQFDFSG